MKVNTLTLKDAEFPDILRHIPSPPEQIFWQGAKVADLLSQPRVAIVGSRKATTYGLAVTHKIATDLARSGVVIISGLAFGIDAAAHRAALEVGGLTVAVLPTPLEQIYPASHRALAHQILATGGSLVSEYPSGSIAHKQNFIARNRLVSGLADVLLITEAAINSGSLHTARFALEQGKTVTTVPGNITNSSSEGCNNLIKSGAVPVTNADDVFFALNIKPSTRLAIKAFRGAPEEKKLLELISQGVYSQEELVLASRLDGPSVSSALTILEINGHIRPQGNGNWIAV